MESSRELASMDAAQLRNLAATFYAQLAERDTERSTHAALVAELKAKQLKIDQLTHEMAILKRWRFDRRSEQLDVVQRSLLDESIEADIEAISLELEALNERSRPRRRSNNRAVWRFPPPSRAARSITNLENTSMQLRMRLGAHRRGREREARLHPGRVRGRATHPRQVGLSPLRTDDPGTGTATRHRQGYPDGRSTRPGTDREISRSLTAVPTGSHLRTRRPRTAALYTRTVGRRLRSSPYAALADAMKALLLAREILHADETPVPMLKPGLGRTHRAYLWSYSSSEYDELKTVIYDFTEGRGGVHARNFLGNWSGKLVCDDFSGYKALFERGVIEANPMAHARQNCMIYTPTFEAKPPKRA